MILNINKIINLNRFLLNHTKEFKTNEMGILNLIKLNKISTECAKCIQDTGAEYQREVKNARDSIVQQFPEKGELLNKYFEVQFDIVKANDFINEHIELQDITKELSDINAHFNEFGKELEKKEFDINIDIDLEKFKHAIETLPISLEDLLLIEFLFE